MNSTSNQLRKTLLAIWKLLLRILEREQHKRSRYYGIHFVNLLFKLKIEQHNTYSWLDGRLGSAQVIGKLIVRMVRDSINGRMGSYNGEFCSRYKTWIWSLCMGREKKIRMILGEWQTAWDGKMKR
ncbi:unnamed protein product (macronuclear) [Paramecium tetraurelia]|uniref:Uncharacterized protein n=1 Tax=Paramecium tetraurelia TaxID=5888 RepID=A0CEQ8_PARTE|nr:uncharacterized protein GSPATT00037714001 [Paramecium tetraurelia]CAK69275.1 unnamed protein product [Paramecium tetraurelia]|eukprot:XP_001436672.1 hypothetical protein (macronuclear) [Paramecium tetraurelia strain d4-2]